MEQKLRIGIVGAHRGRSFLPGFATQADVVALCDLDPEYLKQTADRAGIELRYTSYEEMLDKAQLDAVVVCTPMPFHVPQSVAALQRGIHVLSEVPAATDLEQCWQLVEAARASRARYMMAENCCYMKPAVLVRGMARAGLFGDLYYAEGAYIHELKDRKERSPWRRFWQLGINGSTYSTHSLGPLLQWMRTRVVSVTCMGSGHHYTDARGTRYGNEDSTTVLGKLANGGMIHVRLDLLSNRPPNLPHYNYTLQGTNGCYEAPRADGEPHRVWLKDRCPDERAWRSLWDFESEFLPEAWRNPSESVKRAGHDGSDYFQALDFIECIERDSKPTIDLYDALDMTVPGLVSQESIRRDSMPLPVPDFRTIRKFPDDLPTELQESWILRVRED